jgi:hypothetical protein
MALPLSAASIIVDPQHQLRRDAWTDMLAMDLALEYSQGNTNVIGGEGALTGRFQKPNSLFLAIADGAYGEEDGSKYQNKTMAHLRYYQRLLPGMGMEFFGQNQYDEFRRLALRGLMGGGPRFTLHSASLYEISAGVSYFYEYNRYGDDPSYSDADDEAYYHRLSHYLYLHLVLKDNLSLNSTLYYQPAIGEWENYRFFASSALTVNLFKGLSLSLRHAIVYDSEPPLGVKKRDHAFQTSVRFAYEAVKAKED